MGNPKLEEITKLLNDELYASSKDWRDGDLVERVYWLLSSYESKVSECDMLWQMLEETRNGESK